MCVLILQNNCDIISYIQDFLDKRSEFMRVYEKVREYIDINGYKQVTIAKKAGMPTATFNAIMNGKRTLYADDLRAICLALNVSPEVFIEIKKNPQKNKQLNNKKKEKKK